MRLGTARDTGPQRNQCRAGLVVANLTQTGNGCIQQ